MKIYLITYRDCGYDTYDSICIIANNRKEARDLANQQTHNQQKIKSINLINTSRQSIPRILCASFNAG